MAGLHRGSWQSLSKISGGTHQDNQIHLYKILVIGEFGVGKTSVIKQYTEGTFSPNYKLTIGVDFALKNLRWNKDTTVKLQLWDIAGHERFGSMTRIYYKYAIAAVIVFDATRPATFDAVIKWLKDVHSKVIVTEQESFPVLLLANKCDLGEAQIDKQKIDDFCQKHGLIGWYPTSAKDNINIEQSMTHLVEHIMQLQSTPPEGTELSDFEFSDSVTLDGMEDILMFNKEKSCCMFSH